MPLTRRTFLAGAAAAAAAPRVAWAAPAVADGPVVHAPPLDDRGYLRLADRIMDRLNHTWVRHKQAYSAGSLEVGTIYNAAILTVHATAAEAGHVGGRSRNDARARLLVERLIGAPPFFTGSRARRGKMYHSPGWLADLDRPDASQDKSIDPKVAEALLAAWRARDVLGLAPATVERLTRCVDGVARGSFFRFPSVRLNQINWNAELYACAAALTGDPELLREDYRKHLRRFVAGVRRPLRAGGTTNLGRGYQFHYLPHFPRADRANLDSAEYANITLHALHAYEPALAAGMAPLPAEDVAILRAWVERTLFGYWMHGGMLNWDSGLGIGRWMKAKTWAYAQQGLLTIASAPRFAREPEYPGWAKHMFDRGLALYERMLVEGNTRAYPSAHLYGATTRHQTTGDKRIFSARMAANAARAVTLGLGRMSAPEPPPFYAFDPDTGRLAVSTPRYSTAIVPDNRGAFPYGGIAPARLFDAAAQPVGSLGGRGPAAFGLVVRGPSGRLATQTSGRGQVSIGGRRARGTFSELEAVARIAGPDATITARHRFTATALETEWTIQRRRAVTVEAQFPTTEGEIAAVYGDGRVVPLQPGRPGVKLDGVVRLELGGYTVTLPGLRGGSARAVHVARQATAPRPGPTLVVRVPRETSSLRARITVR